MMMINNYTLNLHGQLVSLHQPLVMGILNVTPDSFYSDSRQQSEEQIIRRAHEIVDQGATFIDIGACSTRPNSEPVSQTEEIARLRKALTIIRKEFPATATAGPFLSVDTFRPDVARMAVEEFGVDIINDVSEGNENMFRMTARLGTPYILMSVQNNLRETLLAFAEKIQQLRNFGQKDIILDPGFGFGKSIEENFRIFQEMEKIHVLELPLLVGISRKSMIYKTLNCTPQEALCGTIFLNTLALQKGASILRVHDVKEAVSCCLLHQKLMEEQQ